MIRNLSNTLIVTIVLLCCCVVESYGQRTTGNLEGTISDTQGALIPGINVKVTGISVGFSQIVQSDAQGKFRVSQIPAGTYKITTGPMAGFASTTADNITVTIEKSTIVNIKLGLATTSESVIVTSDETGVNLDVTDSKVHTNITQKLIDDLPSGTNFSSLLRAAAPVRSESKSGGLQIDGASGSENTFILNGMPVENFRTGVLNGVNNIPTTLVYELQVKSGGFEAEHGGASGGVIVVQTKSGTNSFHGEFSSEFTSSRLQPGPRTAISRFAASNDDFIKNPDHLFLLPQKRDKYLNLFPTATLSGPIIRDRVWFLTSYSPQIFRTTRTSEFISPTENSNFSTGQFIPSPRIKNGVPIAPLTYKEMNKYEYAFTRVDTQILSNLRGAATFLWNPLINRGVIPAAYTSITTADPVDTLYNGINYRHDKYNRLRGGRNNSNLVTGQLTYTPMSNIVTTFRFGRTFLNEKSGSYGIVDETKFTCTGNANAYKTINHLCPGGRGYTNIGENSLTLRDLSIKRQFNFDIEYLPRQLGGKHELKGGYEHGNIMNDVSEGYAKTGRVTLYYGQDYTQAGLSVSLPCKLGSDSCKGVGSYVRIGTSGVGKSNFKGFYIQDKWQPSRRLALNLGVRLESEYLPSFNEGDLEAGIAVPGISIGWSKKIAPRLGGALDLTGNGKTKIFASYGWFYDRMRFELPRGSFGGDFYRVDYFPITADHPEYSYYTPERIMGNWKDPYGGGDPSTQGGLSKQQVDNRIPSNLTKAQFEALGLIPVGVDPNIKAFRQVEFTLGLEKELFNSYLLSIRFTRKNIAHTIEDHSLLGLNESENYLIGNPGEGFNLIKDIEHGYVKSAKPQRLYRALEIVLNKRLSNKYYFNLNYTLSGLYGNYSGLASSDEDGRTSPGVNRFFDYAINGYTALGLPDNGYLATDRRHVFKSYGGYTFNKWLPKSQNIDLGYFFTAMQGIPQTTFLTITRTSVPLYRRGDMGRSPTYTQTDLSLSYNYKLTERFRLGFNINASNVFNQNTVTGFNTTKYRVRNTIRGIDIDPNYVAKKHVLTPILNRVLNGDIHPQLLALDNSTTNPIRSTYGRDSGYQGARSLRFGFSFKF